jgi:hypothetical protein
MPVALSKKINGKKFMWDGMTHENGDQAAAALENYRKEGFEAEMVVEDERFLVYTRRLPAAQSGS